MLAAQLLRCVLQSTWATDSATTGSEGAVVIIPTCRPTTLDPEGQPFRRNGYRSPFLLDRISLSTLLAKVLGLAVSMEIDEKLRFYVFKLSAVVVISG